MIHSSSEEGYRWEIRRKYIPIQRASRVRASALWLAGQTEVYGIARRRPFSIFDLTRGLSETGINTKILQSKSSHTLEDARAADVLSLVQQMNIETGDTTGGFLVSRQVCGGKIGWHRDNDGYTAADDSLSVNVAGRCRVGIKDLNGDIHRYDLDIGDAFYLDNSGPDEQRPAHTVRNIGLRNRIAVID